LSYTYTLIGKRGIVKNLCPGKNCEPEKPGRTDGHSKGQIGPDSHWPEKRLGRGGTAWEQIDAAKKAKEAGMSVSEYLMPGLRGKSLFQKNAPEKARVLKAMNSDYILQKTFFDAADDHYIREGSLLQVRNGDGGSSLWFFLDFLD
jgi:hypothetical protein